MAGERITRRLVLHFTGFEPLDADAHRRRYERAAGQSAKVWQTVLSVGLLKDDGHSFDVAASGADWRCDSTVHIFDHAARIEAYRNRRSLMRILAGFGAAAQVVAEGAAWRYFRHAWRFGLFFLFPFAMMAGGMMVSALIALAPVGAGLPPVHLLWSLPLAFVGFGWVFLPFSNRHHVLHLFSDWQMALALARLDDPDVNALLDGMKDRARVALIQPADEILVTSHSIGSNLAVHVLAELLEERPDLFEGRRIAFVTLGGAVLQCAFMRSASRLREQVGTLAAAGNILWLDIQCLTDVVSFYRSQTFALCGQRAVDSAKIRLVRFKKMLEPAHYKRIKRDFLRVHRQYVLAVDRRCEFDFTMLTAGPYPAAAFAGFKPGAALPFGDDGTIERPETAAKSAQTPSETA